MILIFGVDNDFNIGYKGEMLHTLKEDLKHFKNVTKGHIVVMGRKTLESLPGGRPLKNRTNVVLTTDTTYQPDNAVVLHSLEALKMYLAEEVARTEQRVFLIGGGHLVAQLYDQCDYAYITKADISYDDVDTAIPNLDKDPNWRLLATSELMTEGSLTYRYLEYKRIT